MNIETLDVVIIGAGLSGIAAAIQLKKQCPHKSFSVLEARTGMGGTWDLFKYPGIRSDSDMYTLGYSFKPWSRPNAIANGGDILGYIQAAASEHNIHSHIRYQHMVSALNWSSEEARWTLTIQKTNPEQTLTIKARFVLCCSGYYRYDQGYTPNFNDQHKFKGQIIHPQFWPQQLDYSNKKIVIIGSGATAVTLLASLADKAAKVTMLQRSPGYVASIPQEQRMPGRLKAWLPEKTAYQLIRARNSLLSMGFYSFSRKYPQAARRTLLKQVKKQLSPDYDMTHFNPSYNVWDQRLCAVPDGDLFKALRHGKAEIVTDHIQCFTKTGINLQSGQQLDADIIITATGLNIQILGGMQLTVDGQNVRISEKHYYKGAMLEDIPNLALVFGYTNASWTLKAELIIGYFCRLINYMDQQGYIQATPKNNRGTLASSSFLDLASGYVQRAIDSLPRQGHANPWKMHQNYFKDYVLLKLNRLDDGVMRFSKLDEIQHASQHRKVLNPAV